MFRSYILKSNTVGEAHSVGLHLGTVITRLSCKPVIVDKVVICDTDPFGSKVPGQRYIVDTCLGYPHRTVAAALNAVFVRLGFVGTTLGPGYFSSTRRCFLCSSFDYFGVFASKYLLLCSCSASLYLSLIHI